MRNNQRVQLTRIATCTRWYNNTCCPDQADKAQGEFNPPRPDNVATRSNKAPCPSHVQVRVTFCLCPPSHQRRGPAADAGALLEAPGVNWQRRGRAQTGVSEVLCFSPCWSVAQEAATQAWAWRFSSHVELHKSSLSCSACSCRSRRSRMRPSSHPTLRHCTESYAGGAVHSSTDASCGAFHVKRFSAAE